MSLDCQIFVPPHGTHFDNFVGPKTDLM